MLSRQVIFFGHQSVGGNMLQGVAALSSAHPHTGLDMIEIRDANAVSGPAIYHTLIGRNFDPISKIAHFDMLMRAGVGGKADIAFFKFCYVDFDQNTDAAAIFAAYKVTLDALAAVYTQTKIVHMTVPLTVERSGLKILVKRILGRYDDSFGNVQRHRFNKLLRKEYAGKAPIFDLAAIEAVYGDQTVPSLRPEYTDDGGHLNSLGQAQVAEQLLTFLAALASGPSCKSNENLK